MAMIVLLSRCLGLALGLRFKVLVLLPAATAVLAAAACVGMMRGSGVSATKRPSGVMVASREKPLPTEALVLTLISVVVLLTVSRTKMSLAALVSPATRSEAVLSKTTNWPLLEMALGKESPLPPAVPAALTLASRVIPVCRSRRKTFMRDGKSCGIGCPARPEIKLAEVLAKSTYRPSGETMGL